MGTAQRYRPEIAHRAHALAWDWNSDAPAHNTAGRPAQPDRIPDPAPAQPDPIGAGDQSTATAAFLPHFDNGSHPRASEKPHQQRIGTPAPGPATTELSAWPTSDWSTLSPVSATV